jgi:limonene-1,2-epoxide hydrolase
MTPAELAEAFSRHQFSTVHPHLAADVRWENVGGDTLLGRDAVIAHCDASSRYLASVTTAFSRVDVIASDDAVVVESVASYTNRGGVVSRVASCDVYRFSGREVVAIASYNVDVTAD